jgi:succinyl-diaminopimelate desuccinylase
MLQPTTLAELRATTEQLVRIPSVSSDRERCHEVLDVIRASVPNWESFHSEVFEYQGYRSLIVSTRPGRAAPLILNGHVDVVTATEPQFTPELRDDGLLWGRGVYDMKGAVAVYVELLKKLAPLPEAQRPHLQIQFVSDEEIGGHRGVERMVNEGFDTDLFVAGEPTDLDICNQAKGVLWMRYKLSGQPGHAARPWLCRNPLAGLARGLHHIYGRFPVPVEPVWETTATVTGIDVGENAHNRVPSEATAKIDCRYVPQDDPQQLIEWFRGVMPDSELEIVQLAVPLFTPEDHPKLVRARAIGEQVLGRRPNLFSEHFASDARYYSAKGTPALCWGPSGAGMHADDERLSLESLETYARLVDQLVLEMAR